MSRGAAASTAPSLAGTAQATSTLVGAGLLGCWGPLGIECVLGCLPANLPGCTHLLPTWMPATNTRLPPPPLAPPPPISPAPWIAVGSKEGWQPSTFRSSRETRGAVQAQSVEQYLDEDELEELRRTNLQVGG